MIFKRQKLHQVFLIEAEPRIDERGIFRRHFCQDELAKAGVEFTVKQGNISENKNRLTLRGFHYQKAPGKESKIISCISGSIFNVIVDLRKDSPTFLQWQNFSISAEGRESLYVPVGCANAFLTTEDDTRIHYYMNDFFSTESLGFRYNDSLFSVQWPFEPKFISDRDLSYPNLNKASL